MGNNGLRILRNKNGFYKYNNSYFETYSGVHWRFYWNRCYHIPDNCCYNLLCYLQGI